MKVETVAVIGTGTMGAGIAQVFAQRGCATWIHDVAPGRLEAAQAKIREVLGELGRAGTGAPKEMEAAISRVHTCSDLERAVGDADFVVEAVPEVLSTKQAVFSQLDRLCRPEVVLATNTSGLSVSAIASATNRPERVVGMHWWNPPYLIPVVEVIRGQETADETLETTRRVVESLGKKPVVVQKDVPGFLGNRMLYALIREALFCLEQGIASPEDIDTVVRDGIGFKFPVYGPLETLDLAGLDIYLKVSQYLNGELCRSTSPPDWLRQRVEAGELGQKSGKGFYTYTGDAAARAAKKRSQLMGLARQLGYL